MNKHLFTLASFAAVVMVAGACQKDNATEQAAGNECDSFVASIGGDDTKTVIDGTTVKWSAGDEVSVNGVLFTAYPSATDATVANLWKKNQSVSNPRMPYKAFYPASIVSGDVTALPAAQTYGTFALNPMYAVSYDGYLKFKNLCAILKIFVGPEDVAKVKSVRVSSSDCFLSGEFTVAKTDAGYKAVITDIPSAVRNVVLECGEGVAPETEGTAFFVAIPAQTYKNLKIELSEDGTNYYKSMTAKQECNAEESVMYKIDFENDSAFLLIKDLKYNKQAW